MSKRIVECLIFFYIIIIYGFPFVPLYILYQISFPTLMRIVIVFVSPLVFSFSMVITAGMLSIPFQKAIVRGRFPRDMTHPIYGRRRLYGLCWTAIYYCNPVYWVALSVPFMKTMMFRLFGYKGSMNFTIYPDTWIRDLPLLCFEDGAYIANRATLGTNMVLPNGTILVDRIHVGENATVGHLAAVAPGARIGSKAQVGTAAAIGMGATLEANSHVSATARLDHGATLKRGAKLGTAAYLGVRSTLGESGLIEPGASFPANTRLPGKSVDPTE